MAATKFLRVSDRAHAGLTALASAYGTTMAGAVETLFQRYGVIEIERATSDLLATAQRIVGEDRTAPGGDD